MEESKHIGSRWPLEDSNYYCHFSMWHGGVEGQPGASRVISQGNSGTYILVLVQDPKGWSNKVQQGMRDSKGQARKTQKF